VRPVPEAKGRTGDELVRVGDLRDNDRAVVGQLLAMSEGSDTDAATGFALSEISVGLGFDANGKLGFIAAASAPSRSPSNGPRQPANRSPLIIRAVRPA
jgi:hypothetical protein